MVYRIPTAKRALLTNVHYAAAAHKYTYRICMYSDAVRPIHFAIRLYYIARFTPRIESHDPPRVRSGSDTCKVYLPACLPTWMTRYLCTRKGTRRGVEKSCGPNVVGLYRKDTIRGDLILAPVYEYERMDIRRSGGKSKKNLRLIIISRRDAGADINRGNHCGIRSNEHRS